MPLQFLPAHNALVEEALAAARDILYEDTSTRVLRAEHLVAICLQTGRAKDRERVRVLHEQANLDADYLRKVVATHNLEAPWKGWST